MVGVIEQHGVRYLFQCWAGEVERANMWLYTLLDEDQVRFLADQDRPFSEALEQATTGEGVLAVALDERIVGEESRAVELLRATA